jgi:hypothetical protein
MSRASIIVAGVALAVACFTLGFSLAVYLSAPVVNHP